MSALHRLSELIRDRKAGISIASAFAMTMLIGAAALAVDVGSLYLDRRKLQGIADAAALAAAGRPGEERAAAERIIAANCNCAIRIAELATGHYAADRTIAADRRFTPGGASPNAVRIVLHRDRPLYFGRALTGRNQSVIAASATGARRGYAAFSLGSRVAAVNGGLPNALLSGLTGSQVSLSLMDYNALASTDIDLLAFSEALRSEIDAEVLTFGQTLDTQVTLPQVLSALAQASDGQAAQALEHIASRALPRTLLPSRAIDLGPRASSIRADAANPVKVNALGLLRTMLLLGSANRQVDLSVASNLPGGSGIDIALLIGEPPAQSPLIAVTDTNDVIVRTAQVRLKLDPAPASLVRLPLVSIDAEAELVLSDLAEKPAIFSRADIDEGRVKTVSSSGWVAGAAKSLSDRMDLSVRVLGLGLNLNALRTATAGAVTLAAPVLDTVLADITGTLGLSVGQADARVNALRCGRARLV